MHTVSTLALLAVMAGGPQADKPRVVVYPFSTTGLPESVGSSLSEVVATQVARSGRYDVLTWQNIFALLKIEEVKQALGTDDPKQIVKVSEKFNAAFIITGNVNQLGGAYVVSLQLVNVAAVKVDRRITQTLYGDASQISASLRTASQALVAEMSPEKAQSVSEKAFESVLLSEVPKTLNARLSAGYRFPLGAAQNDSGLFFVRAPQAVVSLDTGWMAAQWLETGLAVSFGLADGGEAFQGRLATLDSTSDPISGAPKEIVGVTVLDMKPVFSVRDLTIAAQARLRPPVGVFLPYVAFRAGAALDRREVRSEKAASAFPGVGGTACPGWATYDEASGACLADVDLAPTSEVSWRTGFAAGASAGLDLLLSRHFGLTAGVGYEIRYWGSEEDVDLTASSTYAGPPSGAVTFVDRYKLPSFEQSLVATVGVLGFY
ncbi:MAG: hypothetical protein HY897_20750 [Deltaproteobacteria bacterium]|nr:hypothetical protein [Deltaproteobacteria bacterium]